MGIAGVGCVAVIGLLIGMLAGAALLRAAVSAANRLIGRVEEEPADPVEDWDWDAEPDEPRPRRPGGKFAIPEPGVGKGMMIASAANLLTAFAGVVLGVVAEEVFGDMEESAVVVLALLLLLPFAFAAFTALLVPMLPTTFWRAAQVAFLYHLFGLAVLLAVGGGVAAAVRVLDG